MALELANPLMAAALRMTRRRAEAEDLVQETLYRAYRGLAGYEPGTHFRAWLFRILHNLAINRSRREGRAPDAVDPATLDPVDGDHPVPALVDLSDLPDLADRHFDDRVKAALDDLPEIYRVPLVLFSLGDLSYQEIADSVGVPIGTVMSRLHRARSRLKAALSDHVAGRRGGAAGGGDG